MDLTDGKDRDLPDLSKVNSIQNTHALSSTAITGMERSRKTADFSDNTGVGRRNDLDKSYETLE